MDNEPKNRPHFSLGTWAAVLLTLLLLFLTFVFFRSVTARKKGDQPDTVTQIMQGRERQASPEPAVSPNLPAGKAGTPEPSVSPAAQATQEPAEVTQETPGFTLAAAGTVSVPRAVRDFAQEGNRYDFSTVFLGLGNRITGADLTLCTLETLTDDRQPYDSVNAPSSILDTLSQTGVDFVSLATEHMLDKGYDSLDVTLSELNLRSMTALGVRQETGMLPGTILQIGGIRTAVLAYTYGISEEGSAATRMDRRDTAAKLTDEKQVAMDIAAARASGAETVILLVHWGIKNRADVPDSVRALAARLAEAGADLILGTHPSTVQPVERLSVHRSDGLQYDAVVAYSLGSLLTDARTEENAAGLVLNCTFEKDPQTGRVSIHSLFGIPTYVARQEEDGAVSWRVVEADNEASVAVLKPEERAAAQHAAALVGNAMSGVQ